jgi:hypothetical protein
MWLVSWLVGAATFLSAVSAFSQQPPFPDSITPVAQQTLASKLDSTSRSSVVADSTANTSNVADPPAAVASASEPKNGFIKSWSKRVSDTLSTQPSWAIPLVTASSGLLQVLRYDIVRQVTPTGDTWNYGNSKGLNLIPWYRLEFDTAIPPYLQHSSPKVQDGFGDLAMLLKYRVVAGNATHGNYSLSLQLGTTLPTGSYKNGSPYATISPALCAGKGFGRFDVQSTIGGTVPMQGLNKLGSTVVWNTAAQYHFGKLFWPEIENNATFFDGGRNKGLMQNFVTPGLIVGKVKMGGESYKRLGLLFGAGMQIATSHFHTYNHGLVVTSRMCF